MSKAFIVMASGTEVGKTYASCALLRAARDKGMRAKALKPIMSGFDADNLHASDAGQLITAMGEGDIDDINLYRFTPELAPNVAAREAGAIIDFNSVTQFCRARLDADFCLVEGAGGVLSPIDDTHSNADLARELGLPALLITSNYLGSVSHTLTAIEACESRGISIAAVAVSQPAPTALPPFALIEELKRWSSLPFIALPFGAAGGELLDVLLSYQDPKRSNMGE